MKWLMAGAFGLLQFVLAKKGKSGIVRYGLMGVLAAGWLVCAFLYFGFTEGVSQSVIAENRTFALFLAEMLAYGMVGCAAGHMVGKLRQ